MGSNKGYSALHLAIVENEMNMINLLLEYNASITVCICFLFSLFYI